MGMFVNYAVVEKNRQPSIAMNGLPLRYCTIRSLQIVHRSHHPCTYKSG